MATETKTKRSSNSGRERSSGGARERSRSSGGGGSGSRASGNDGGRRRSDTNANAEDRKFLDRYGDNLSDSTRRARWIHSPDERPERKGQTLATRSPEVIRAWAEERDGRPATATRGDDGRPRTLRIMFGDGSGGDGSRRRRLEEIGWDEWLGVFTDRNLVFIYQDQRRDGRQSNFFRLDSPEREEG